MLDYHTLQLSTLVLSDATEIQKLREETLQVCLRVLQEGKFWRGDYSALARTTAVN